MSILPAKVLTDLILSVIVLQMTNPELINCLITGSPSLRSGECGAEPVPLTVAPLRGTRGTKPTRFAAAQPRIVPNNIEAS